MKIYCNIYFSRDPKLGSLETFCSERDLNSDNTIFEAAERLPEIAQEEVDLAKEYAAQNFAQFGEWTVIQVIFSWEVSADILITHILRSEANTESKTY